MLTEEGLLISMVLLEFGLEQRHLCRHKRHFHQGEVEVMLATLFGLSKSATERKLKVLLRRETKPVTVNSHKFYTSTNDCFNESNVSRLEAK